MATGNFFPGNSIRGPIGAEDISLALPKAVEPKKAILGIDFEQTAAQRGLSTKSEAVRRNKRKPKTQK